MKLTKAQQNDIDCIKWFVPSVMKNIEITDDDVHNFLDYSERGKNKELIGEMPYKMDGFNALYQGKRWRGVHIHEMYQQGVLDGSIPYHALLEDMPRVVVDYLKKEMFKGKDADIIERCYTLHYGN